MTYFIALTIVVLAHVFAWALCRAAAVRPTAWPSDSKIDDFLENADGTLGMDEHEKRVASVLARIEGDMQ